MYIYNGKDESGRPLLVKCRNVRTKNAAAALQFQVEQVRGAKGRSFYFTFALPASEIEAFIREIQQ